MVESGHNIAVTLPQHESTLVEGEHGEPTRSGWGDACRLDSEPAFALSVSPQPMGRTAWNISVESEIKALARRTRTGGNDVEG